MKHTKTVTVPAREETVTEKVTCDLCGNEIKKERGNAENVEVKHTTGSSYPDGGMGEEVSVDLCGTCFDTKLIPWLTEQGAVPATREWDY